MAIPTTVNDQSLPQINWVDSTADVVKVVSTGRIGLRITTLTSQLFDPINQEAFNIGNLDKVYEGTIDPSSNLVINIG